MERWDPHDVVRFRDDDLSVKVVVALIALSALGFSALASASASSTSTTHSATTTTAFSPPSSRFRPLPQSALQLSSSSPYALPSRVNEDNDYHVVPLALSWSLPSSSALFLGPSSSSSDPEDDVSSLSFNIPYTVAYVAFLTFAYIRNSAEDASGAVTSMTYLQSCIAEPTNPEGWNKLFLVVFNYLGLAPLLLLSLIIPGITKTAATDEGKGEGNEGSNGKNISIAAHATLGCRRYGRRASTTTMVHALTIGLWGNPWLASSPLSISRPLSSKHTAHQGPLKFTFSIHQSYQAAESPKFLELLVSTTSLFPDLSVWFMMALHTGPICLCKKK